MKSKAAVLVMAVAMVLAFANVGLAAKVVFQDNFATFDPAWGTPNASQNVKDGKLVITPSVNTTHTMINQGQLLPDAATISFNMTFLKAPAPTWGSGVVFWATDYDSYYALLINANGWYTVQRRVGKRYLTPVTWRKADTIIKKGAGAVNQVTIVTKDNKATISVNGKELISFTGQPPQGGSFVGFKASYGTKPGDVVGFSDLKVTQP